ncbi:MAG: transketolase [Bacteroidales bacterium]|nr:transketolase [Bacteroidales bacterium]
MNKEILTRTADNIRILSAAMVEKAKSGHPGGAMGGADFVSVLFSDFLRFDPEDMSWANRDRFFLDPGHMSPMLYSVLSFVNTFSMDDLQQFRQWGSPTPGHPEVAVKRGVENTSGPLGQGHAIAIGAAIAERFLCQRFGEWMAHDIYTFISDGGIQEEISQGAGRLAGYLGLHNLVMFYDSNDIQLSTKTEAVTTEDTAKKYESWGWKVKTIEGNDIGQIYQSLQEAREEKDKPFLIIGKTIMGKGAVTESGESFERQVSTHGMPLGNAGASLEKSIENLGGDPGNAFQIFPEVKEHFQNVLKEKAADVKQRKAAQAAWEKENPELAAKLARFLSKEPLSIDFSQIVQKENSATRGASGTVLSYFAQNLENMIVASADLSNSDKTDGFLNKSKAFARHDFSGAFLQVGVAELTMAAIANGMALHGGIIPVCATFFVFSDYMKPAVRLAALMELPVKYVWTHDAFRVGEDGPTHQPVEQEAQIRLMEQLRNHSGKRSCLVLRPADAAETTVAWKMALENKETPTALILSRQNITDIPAFEGSDRFTDALHAEKGAYIVQHSADNPDLILIGNGSEVSILLEGARKLNEQKKLNVQVVSAISEGLFRDQELAYQQEVIPDGVPVLGLTAGLPVTLAGLVGPHGRSLGMVSFGYSAPYKVLDEKFGFTTDNVFNQALSYLEEFK